LALGADLAATFLSVGMLKYLSKSESKIRFMSLWEHHWHIRLVRRL
jgi:hypothetical protein